MSLIHVSAFSSRDRAFSSPDRAFSVHRQHVISRTLRAPEPSAGKTVKQKSELRIKLQQRKRGREKRRERKEDKEGERGREGDKEGKRE